MGWGRMLLLGNVGQQMDIGDLDQTVDQMRAAFRQNQIEDHEQAQSIEQLQQENHDLKLYLATLMRLLVAKGVLKQEEVDSAVQAIEKN
jgi:hypothetical protein